jgi:3-isopropylmalate dehydrogenase
MATHKLLLLPGDGIGPEVMGEVKRLIGWLNKEGIASFETEEGLVGGAAYDASKQSITDATMDVAKAADAVIFGAVGGPKWDAVPYEVRPEAGLLRLRKDLGLFANLRPAVCYPALADASSLKREAVEGLDIMIVRELTGGVYFGEPKTITDLGNGQKRAVDTQVYDTYEIERIGRVAFDLARKRRNKVTSMEKRNVMKSGVLWNEVMTQLHAREYKDVTLEHQLADSGGMMLVKWPKQFDVIVTDNLFGDMLSDIARRGRCQDEEAPLAFRAGAWLGARHRRQGPCQSDRDDFLVRHGAALLLRHGHARRQDRSGHRRGARQRPSYRRHQVGRHDPGDHASDGRGDPERAAEAALTKKPGASRAFSRSEAKLSTAGSAPDSRRDRPAC